MVRTVLVWGSLACAQSATAAQLTSLPIFLTPNDAPELRTIMVAGDIVMLHENTNDFTPIAARFVLNVRRLSVMAGVGVMHDPNADNEFTLGGSIGYDLHSASRRNPKITLQGGAGHVRIHADAPNAEALDRWDLPLGVGIAWNVLALQLNVQPWVAPRAHVRFLEVGVGEGYETDLGVGTSAGLNFTHAVGPGIHFGFDGLLIEGPRTSERRVEWVLSAGVHFKVALP